MSGAVEPGIHPVHARGGRAYGAHMAEPDNDVVGDLDGDALRAEAKVADEFSEQIRDTSYEFLAEKTGSLGIERDTAARTAESAADEAKSADIQIQQELEAVKNHRAMADRWRDTADADGDIFAREDAERVNKATALADAAQARADAAQERATELRATAEEATAEVARIDTELADVNADYDSLSRSAMNAELRASTLEDAAGYDAEADAAEAQAAQLRDEGDVDGALVLEEGAARQRAYAAMILDEASHLAVDEDVLGEVGIAVPDGFVNPEPVAEAAAEVPEVPAPTVIDMEPEVIEVPPSRVIDFEPEIIEVPPPRVIDFEPEVIEVDPGSPDFGNDPSAEPADDFEGDGSGFDDTGF